MWSAVGHGHFNNITTRRKNYYFRKGLSPNNKTILDAIALLSKKTKVDKKMVFGDEVINKR